MLALGIIIAIVGLAASVYAFVQRSSAEYILASAFGHESAATMDMILYAGIAALVVGVILIIVHFAKNKK